MNSKITLYDKTNIDKLEYEKTEYNEFTFNYLMPLIKNGTKMYIKNVETEIKILKIDNLLIPINICDENYKDSYVTSMYTHYVTYAIEELRELKNPLLEKCLKQILLILGKLYKLGKINKAIYVNNWLLSTNLYTNITSSQYKDITEFIQNNYPNHAIIFRSINDSLLNKEKSILENLNYKMLGSRQIYIFDRNKLHTIRGPEKNKIYKDIKLLKNSNYIAKDITENNYNDIIRLYNQLYLIKYSKNNPQFTQNYIKYLFENNLFKFKILINNEHIDAAFGYYKLNNVITTPIFGYNISLPKETALYRLLSALLVQEADKENCILNESSGASKFKMYRGARASLEYSAIFYKHLPIYRKLVFKILCFFINKIALSIVKMYKL